MEQGGVGQGQDTEFQKRKLRLREGGILGRRFLEGAWVVGTRGSEFRCCTECNSPSIEKAVKEADGGSPPL